MNDLLKEKRVSVAVDHTLMSPFTADDNLINHTVAIDYPAVNNRSFGHRFSGMKHLLQYPMRIKPGQ